MNLSFTGKSSLLQILNTKIELLCNGLILPNPILDRLNQKGKKFSLGRKGGAGPAGGRYFRFSNGSIVNTPLWVDENEASDLILEDVDENGRIFFKSKTKSAENYAEFHLIENPAFYSLKNHEGIEFQKIGLIHGDSTMATTINQRCKYWRSNQQCKFCGIEFSIESQTTIEKKTGEQLIELINVARQENSHFTNHITLTIGTTSNPDKGMQDYLDLIHEIKPRFPNLKIHIQIEPMSLKSKNWYEILHAAGVDTIGIHIEVLDDKMRKYLCPGKGSIPFQEYCMHWEEAIKVFGKNQVDTFILTGFDPDLCAFKNRLKKIIHIGVIPLITPAKSILGTNLKIPSCNISEFKEIILFAANECIEVGLNPIQNQAGCIKCGGCSPIIDAFRLIINQ